MLLCDFFHSANIIECAYTNIGGIACYTPSLMIQTVGPRLQPAQRVTIQNNRRINQAQEEMMQSNAVNMRCMGCCWHNTVLLQNFL